MRLDFFDLELVLHIVETGSFTKGAERSSISLQACSERIKKLEQQYAVNLFTRHASGVKLTLAGQTFIEHAQRILQQGRLLQQAMAPFAQGISSNVTFWCNSTSQSEYLPLLLPQYLIENPNAEIHFKEAESNIIVNSIEQNTVLLGLISSFFKSDQLQTLEFAEDPLVLICPSQHELAQYEQLNLNDILGYPFVGLMQYQSLQQSIETQAKYLGQQIQYRLRLPNFAAIAQVVANGVGIAIIPKRAAQRHNAQFSFKQIQLTGEWANRKLLLTAKNFDDLPVPYQHFAQFLISQSSQFKLLSN